MKPAGISSFRQRGIASVLVVMLLIAGVLFILGQTMSIVGGRSVDTAQQLDSTAALMLAESGIQRAQAVIGYASSTGNMTNADCTGIATGSPFTLGSGSFSYGTPVSTPASCSATSPCNACSVSVTGTVGSASRTVSQTFVLGTVNGTTGRGTTVTMVLKNTYTVPAVALFNLAWRRQAPGGNAQSALTVCASGCSLRWNLESSSGNPSVGGMGTMVDIAASTFSQVVTQVIDFSRDYVEVGALFPSTSASFPQVIGSYWRDQNNGTRKNSGGGGGLATNSGVAGGGTCNAPANPPGVNSEQACTNWCTGADTLVFGVSGRSTTVADEMTGVTFNTSGTPSQNIALTRTVHFPNTDGTIPNASGKVYSEVWYAYNPDYTYAIANATSYPALITATVGALVAPSNISAGATSMSVASSANITDSNSKVCIGDLLSRNDGGQDRFVSGTVVTSTPDALTCSRAAGAYGFSPATSGGAMNGVSVKATSTKLQAISTVGSVALNSVLTSTSTGTTITPTAGPTSGAYTISTATYLTTQRFRQGVSGTTISVPSGTSTPTVGTIVAVYSGSGAFAAQTTVLASPAPTPTSFTVSQAPATALIDAALCGGTCAFFDGPSSTTSNTVFTVAATAGTTQWAGGFVCLKGVDKPNIIPVTSSSSTASRWQEVVQ